MAECVHCGRQLPPQGKFCPSCGKPRAERTVAPILPPPVLPPTGPAPVTPSAPGDQRRGWTALLPSLTRWDVLALIGGVIGAVLWYGWSRMDVEDRVTPKYIILLPIVLVLFRKPIDLVLTPLHEVKKRIPRLLLIAIGLAVPYLVAHYFYKRGVSNFPLAQKSIIWGTILSYVILRIPDTTLLSRVSMPRLPVWLVGTALFWLGSVIVCGDDFTRDFRRLEDGMRTPGWAETIAGTTATVISALVNGALVFQRSSGERREGEDQARYTMDVRTENERTSLVADDQDRLWVYANLKCVKGAVESDLTATVSFSFIGEYANWVSIRSTQFTGGYKAVLLAAKPPSPDAELAEGANVTVLASGTTAEGERIDVPVTIELDGDLEMKVTILS